jgi:general secretion pathway protein K
LVLVLWVLTLLTIIAVGLTQTQRTETALVENQLGGARFRALSDAAIAYTVLSFLAPPGQNTLELGSQEPGAQGPWLPNGAPRLWQFQGQAVSISVFNEASRISLNQADPELLAALMRAVGVGDDDSMRIADAIADWRDEDDLRLLNGAEDADYRDAGRPLGAKDAPFVAVEELQQVLGVEPDLYQRLAPEVTVDTTKKKPDPNFASPAVLAALDNIPLDEAELRVQERDAPLFADSQGASAVNRGGPLYRIQIREQTARGAGRSVEALVEIAPAQDPPYIVHWRRFGRFVAPPISSVGQEADEARR